MRYFFLFFVTFSTLLTNAQKKKSSTYKVGFSELQSDVLVTMPDSIIILGMGSKLTRVYLNGVKDGLIKGLNKSNLVVSYFYLGKESEDTIQAFIEINKSENKAFLSIIPLDSATAKNKNGSNNPLGQNANGVIGGLLSTSGISYQQTFRFNLCIITEINNCFWEATASVDCDPTKKSSSKKLVKKIIECFKKHQYID